MTLINLLRPALTIYRRTTLAAAIAFLIMPGCTPSSELTITGDPSPSTPVRPGQFLTISDPTIKAGVPVSIDFTGENGYATTFEAYNTEDGSVRVAIPPCMDAAGTAFTAGEMTVGIKGSAPLMTLMVADLPPPQTGYPPGAMLRAVLQAAMENYRYTLGRVVAVQADVGAELDGSTYIAAIARQVTLLQSMLDEYDATGQFTISDSKERRTLTAEEMTLADRLLIAVFTGMADEMMAQVTGGASAKASRTRQDGSPAPSQGFDGFAAVQQVEDSIRIGTGGASLVASGVGMVVCIGGMIYTSPGVILVGAVVGMIGAVTAYADGLAGGENSDAFLLNDPEQFNSSVEAGSQIVRYGSNAVSVVPGPLGTAANVVGAGTAGWDFYVDATELRCQQEQANKGLVRAELDDSDTKLFCQSVSIPVEDLDGDHDPDNDGGSGGYSPPECPPPGGSRFTTSTDLSGRRHEYWVSPYDANKRVGPFRIWYPNDGGLAEQGCRNSVGQTEGLVTRWREDGSLISEVNYDEGAMSGWCREYHPSGRVAREVNYVRMGSLSVPDGVDRYYYDSTQLASETVYVHGVKQGTYRGWHSNGVLRIEGGYVNDVMEGQWVGYRSNGQLEFAGAYVNGLLDGRWVRYTADGKIETDCTYAMGVLVACAPPPSPEE